MHKKQIITAGRELGEAKKLLIMIHGRNASAQDILGLAGHLQVEEFALLAPQATNHTWYPYSFLAPPSQNEPWLGSAIDVLGEIIQDLEKDGWKKENIFFLGFSQGACLALEFATRQAAGYGGVIAFTGGLIGDRIYEANYQGDFSGTPVFIGTSDPDPHVPVQRVHDTEAVLTRMKAAVTKKIYPGMGHTINQEELDFANRILNKSS